MASAQVSHHAHDVSTAVVGQATRDDLQGVCNGTISILSGALDRLCLLLQSDGQLHLRSAATWQQPGLQHDVAGDAEGVREVPLHLVQHIARGTAQDDGASLGLLAFRQIREVLLADLMDLEEAALGADHALRQLFGAVADLGTCDAGDAVVVRLPNAADARDVGLEQEMLRQVRDTLLGDDQVRLHLDDVLADPLHLLFLLHEQFLPVRLLRDLYVGLALALLVLERAVKQHHARVLDLTPHPGVRDVLVEHDAVEHLAVRELAA
mmetsp:Transcript_12294/g.31601  ORF Transcript_12294/g.31601 Transcript_12294/m.31601 type:complete len:266 (+) Transcript_12294:325-1122(+)